MRRFRNRQHFAVMPLKECAYSLPHTGKSDPNLPNAPAPKYSPKSVRSSKSAWRLESHDLPLRRRSSMLPDTAAFSITDSVLQGELETRVSRCGVFPWRASKVRR